MLIISAPKRSGFARTSAEHRVGAFSRLDGAKGACSQANAWPTTDFMKKRQLVLGSKVERHERAYTQQSQVGRLENAELWFDFWIREGPSG